MNKLAEIRERHESEAGLTECGLFYGAARQDRAYLLSLVNRMKPFVRHKVECTIGQQYQCGEFVCKKECTCGLAELLDEIE